MHVIKINVLCYRINSNSGAVLGKAPLVGKGVFPVLIKGASRRNNYVFGALTN